MMTNVSKDQKKLGASSRDLIETSLPPDTNFESNLVECGVAQGFRVVFQ